MLCRARAPRRRASNLTRLLQDPEPGLMELRSGIIQEGNAAISEKLDLKCRTSRQISRAAPGSSGGHSGKMRIVPSRTNGSRAGRNDVLGTSAPCADFHAAGSRLLSPCD